MFLFCKASTDLNEIGGVEVANNYLYQKIQFVNDLMKQLKSSRIKSLTREKILAVLP